MLPALAAVVLAILALAADVLGIAWLFGVLLGLAALAVLVTAYFAYARHLLGARGGSVQERVQQFVLERLPWDGQGRALNRLRQRAAHHRPRLQVPRCRGDRHRLLGRKLGVLARRLRSNAAGQGGSGERVSFRRASAAALPFADASFEAAVSNLCFHEVRGVRDKREVVKEALRVLEPGGAFAFQDLFRLKGAYSEIDDLLAAIRAWGVAEVEYIDTGNAEFIPAALRLPFMVGSMGMIYGTK